MIGLAQNCGIFPLRGMFYRATFRATNCVALPYLQLLRQVVKRTHNCMQVRQNLLKSCFSTALAAKPKKTIMKRTCVNLRWVFAQ